MDRKDILNFKTSGFACFKGTINSILVEGSDTWDFLNRITTQKFSKENMNETRSAALLTGKSEIQNLFQAWNRSENSVELFPLLDGHESLLQNLDKLHFSEQLELKLQDRMMWIELRGEKIPFVKFNKVVEEDIGGKKILIIPVDNWGIPGVLMGATEPEDLMAVIKAQSLKVLEVEDAICIKEFFGFTAVKDFATQYQILEMGLDRFIDRNKGCYPGQEVVEKIYTYGRAAKRLVRITLKTDEDGIKKILSDQARALYSDNLQVGHWCQIHRLESGEAFSLGVVQRSIAEKGLPLTFGVHGPSGHIEFLT